MDLAEIMTRLSELDGQTRPTYPRMQYLHPVGKGGSQSFRGPSLSGDMYVVKCQNNPQETHRNNISPNNPLKVLPSELICGRLGQLFTTPACPPAEVVDIPPQIAASTCFVNGPSIAPGPSVGSRMIPGCVDVRDSQIWSLPVLDMVRIVVFHTWLRGEDWQALATGDGTRGYSIDHGYFLTGASWNLALIEGNTPVEAVVMSQFQANLPKDQAAFRGILLIPA